MLALLPAWRMWEFCPTHQIITAISAECHCENYQYVRERFRDSECVAGKQVLPQYGARRDCKCKLVGRAGETISGSYAC